MKFPKRSARGRRRRAQRLLDKANESLAKVPGPSPNPATNLLIGDIAMRGVTMLLGRGVERAALRLRYNDRTAAGVVKGRSWAQTMAATAGARLATRSVPGLLLVTGGLLAKSIVDRSLGPRKAKRAGDNDLKQMADKAKQH